MSSETLTASTGIQAQEAEEAEKVGVGAYISLFFAVCFFSGVFYKMPDAYRWLGAFDFTTLIGKFGSVSGAATSSLLFLWFPALCWLWVCLKCFLTTAL